FFFGLVFRLKIDGLEIDVFGEEVVGLIVLGRFFGLIEKRQCVFDQFDHAIAMRCRNGAWFAQPQFVKLGQRSRVAHAFGLVDRKVYALSGTTQQLRDLVIVGVHAGARIDQKDN